MDGAGRQAVAAALKFTSVARATRERLSAEQSSAATSAIAEIEAREIGCSKFPEIGCGS
jgi:hypothetical protein